MTLIYARCRGYSLHGAAGLGGGRESGGARSMCVQSQRMLCVSFAVCVWGRESAVGGSPGLSDGWLEESGLTGARLCGGLRPDELTQEVFDEGQIDHCGWGHVFKFRNCKWVFITRRWFSITSVRVQVCSLSDRIDLSIRLIWSGSSQFWPGLTRCPLGLSQKPRN